MIINASNNSHNNMKIRKMNEIKPSFYTVFDKLDERGKKLNSKNPLNAVLTSENMFRFYLTETEPLLHQDKENDLTSIIGDKSLSDIKLSDFAKLISGGLDKNNTNINTQYEGIPALVNPPATIINPSGIIAPIAPAIIPLAPVITPAIAPPTLPSGTPTPPIAPPTLPSGTPTPPIATPTPPIATPTPPIATPTPPIATPTPPIATPTLPSGTAPSGIAVAPSLVTTTPITPVTPVTPAVPAISTAPAGPAMSSSSDYGGYSISGSGPEKLFANVYKLAKDKGFNPPEKPSGLKAFNSKTESWIELLIKMNDYNNAIETLSKDTTKDVFKSDDPKNYIFSFTSPQKKIINYLNDPKIKPEDKTLDVVFRKTKSGKL